MFMLIDIPTMFRLEQTELLRLVAAFDEELGLIAHLARTYARHDLEFALDRMSLTTAQLCSFVAMIVGALDKVGIFPLVIAGYFSLRTLFKEQSPTFAEYYSIAGAVIGLLLVYRMSFYYLSLAKTMDEACLVLKHAVQLKKNAQSRGDERSSPTER
jgi:hypothetical protein